MWHFIYAGIEYRILYINKKIKKYIARGICVVESQKHSSNFKLRKHFNRIHSHCSLNSSEIAVLCNYALQMINLDKAEKATKEHV